MIWSGRVQHEHDAVNEHQVWCQTKHKEKLFGFSSRNLEPRALPWLNGHHSLHRSWSGSGPSDIASICSWKLGGVRPGFIYHKHWQWLNWKAYMPANYMCFSTGQVMSMSTTWELKLCGCEEGETVRLHLFNSGSQQALLLLCFAFSAGCFCMHHQERSVDM